MTELKAKRSSTTVTIEKTCEAPILCDEVEIEQVLINLINNGIDAIETLPDRWLRVALTEEQDQVVVRIRDSGNGIPKDVRDRLFDPFFTTKPIGKGT